MGRPAKCLIFARSTILLLFYIERREPAFSLVVMFAGNASRRAYFATYFDGAPGDFFRQGRRAWSILVHGHGRYILCSRCHRRSEFYRVIVGEVIIEGRCHADYRFATTACSDGARGHSRISLPRRSLLHLMHRFIIAIMAILSRRHIRDFSSIS